MRIIGFLYWLLMLVLNRTYRFKVVGLEQILELKKKEQNVIFVFWHNSSFTLFYIYKVLLKNYEAALFTTNAPQGKILAYIGEKFKLSHVDVPMNMDFAAGAKGALLMLKLIEQGQDAIIAIDGPSGPIYKVKPGALYLSQRSGKAIIPCAVAASSKLTLGYRWDKYFVPLPFAKVILAFGQPVRQPTPAELEEKLRALNKKIQSKF